MAGKALNDSANDRVAETSTLLCVSNFPSDVGFAWDFIAKLWVGIAEKIAVEGVRTIVAYPSMPVPSRFLHGSQAKAIVLDATLRDFRSAISLFKYVRKTNVRYVYLTDRPFVSFAYLCLRAVGVNRIVVHDHTSGERTKPTGLKRWMKWVIARLPLVGADDVICVSDYVVRRQIEVALIPASRVKRVWNGLPIQEIGKAKTHEILNVDPERPILICACRASQVKGVQYLLYAFEELWNRLPPSDPRPVLVYVGDGPDFQSLESIRETLRSKDDIIFTGYRSDVLTLLLGAQICIVPSVWHEAFGLGVLEPMSLGRPVVASAVGAIPELIDDGITGRLVPPADPSALADAIHDLMKNKEECERLGLAARLRVERDFDIERQVSKLAEIIISRPGHRLSAGWNIPS